MRIKRTIEQTPWVPRPKSRLTLWLGHRADSVARELIEHVRPKPPPQRPARFAALIRQSFRGSLLAAEAEHAGGENVQVEFRQAFGKPMLVSFDISVTPEQFARMEADLLTEGEEEQSRSAYRVFVKDLLDVAARALWDNPEVAPVALRGRIMVGPDSDGQMMVLHDLRDLGFSDETARPEDCYHRYGPPASDRMWKP